MRKLSRPFRNRRRWLAAFGASGVLAVGCAPQDRASPTVLRFWAMGREGEVVSELVREFERENPGIRVQVQQIPWSAAHEKLLTAHVGRSTPDLAQLGNTWISEFAALRALEPLDSHIAASASIDSADYFGGIWSTNRIDASVYGIPWYVDTRVLFYRKDLLQRAGWDSIPATWSEWRESMQAIKRLGGADHFAILLPMNEWVPPTVLGLQAGSPLLGENDTRGAFSQPAFRRAFQFYVDLFESGLAPPLTNNEVANLYQEFARGYFAMYITGPWNLGEFASRLPADLQDDWGTAPIPGPDPGTPGVSVAGGSSLVLFRGSPRAAEAWRLVEFLQRPEIQQRFWRLTGDLPSRVAAWQDSMLERDDRMHAFRRQLEHVVPTPKIPEWELIAVRLQERAESAVRGAVPPDSALAALDRDVDRILEKRRWLVERARQREVAEVTR